MKKNEILDVLFSAHTEGHQVEVKFNFGVAPVTGTMTRTAITIDGGIFKISSIDRTGQEPVFKGTINSEGYCLKEVSISPSMIYTVTSL